MPRVDPAVLQARLELDRARFDLYRLPPAERERLLAVHQQRQAAATPSRTDQEIQAADQKAATAEAGRLRALEAAKQARTEAARAVAEEHARLLDVEKRQAEFEGDLARRRAALDSTRESTLVWQRRVKEVVDSGKRREVSSDTVDALYSELRGALRTSRDALDDVLSDVRQGATGVPAVGPNPLAELSVEADTQLADEKRGEVERNELRLRRASLEHQTLRTRVLLDQIQRLNESRLQLLPHLSPGRRSEVTGFAAPGRDQAGAELRQVSLVLRAHFQSSLAFVDSLRRAPAARTDAALFVGGLLLKWAIPLIAFGWWRARAEPVLAALKVRVQEADRARGAVGVSAGERVLRVLGRVHSRLAVALLLVVLYRALPDSATALLEVRLLGAILLWTVGGWVVVELIDALVGDDTGRLARLTRMQTSHLRIASLRLIGRAVVVFGTILAVAGRFVGEGTIYAWVFSTCWFAAIPVLLVIVRWWRPVVFELVAVKRKKSALDRWVDAHREGWKSFPVALVGGVVLFTSGLWRRFRRWMTEFELTRRVLAYLFRREMSKKAEDGRERELGPLPDDVAVALSPDTFSKHPVKSVADEEADDLLAQINAPGGGVFAIVGERGMGKTALLRRIRGERGEVTLVSCPISGLDELTALIGKELGLGPRASIEEVGEKLNTKGTDWALLIDDAHHLIHPAMGGLAEFDRVMSAARKHSASCAWVFALDDVVWRFFELSRGARPQFDEVLRLGRWPEEAVGRLLRMRSKDAGVTPGFALVMDRIHEDADEVDVEEARARTEGAYYRMIWDYAEGNPGVALDAWRACLGVTESGFAEARPFRPPDIRELEVLPDGAVFVLRSVVRLDAALPAEIAEATMLPMSGIEDALR